MANNQLKIPRHSDETILSFFKDICIKFKADKPKCNVTSVAGLDYLEDFGSDEFNEISEAIIDLRSTVITSLSLGLPNKFTVGFLRGGNDDSPFFDAVTISFNNQQKLENRDKLWILETLTAQLKPYDPERQISGVPTKEQRGMEAIHEQILTNLENTNQKLLQDTQKFRADLDKQYAEKRQGLETEINGIKLRFATEQHEFETQIKDEKAELEQQRKELDDRSNTHARRGIRKEILRELKERTVKFGLTEGTSAKRRPIQLVLYLMATILGLLAVLYGHPFSSPLTATSTEGFLRLFRPILFSFGAVSTVIYYIRWQNRWFEQHALAEFQFKQFQLDIERASWVVETSMEWNDTKGTAIPDKLLESMSKNLFTNNSQQPEEAVHPADQLASALLGTASSVKLKAGDSEIILDPKKLAKQKDGPKKPDPTNQ